LNQESIDIFIENFKKLILKNIQETYINKNKTSSSSSFNCLNNLVITLRECLASFNWNYSRDVGFLSPTKKKKKSVVLHHYLFLVTPLPDCYDSLSKFVENKKLYQQQHLIDNKEKVEEEEEEEEEEEDPSILKEKMDILLDKFQNDFIKKALWTAYLNNKIGINWIDTNLKNKNNFLDSQLIENTSKTVNIIHEYIYIYKILKY